MTTLRRLRGLLAYAPDALLGVLAAVVGIAFGHLVAGFTNPAASPVLAVGSTVIDATPTPVKEFAVAQFGTNDKPILLASVILVTLLAAALAGILAARRVSFGVGFILLLTGLATAAALIRPVATALDALPGLAAAVAGVVALLGLRRLRLARQAATSTLPASRTIDDAPEDPVSAGTAYPTSPNGRRQFLLGAAGASAAAVGAAALGQRVANASGPGSTTLPGPAVAARPLPQGIERTVRGVSPLRIANSAFYRVDTNLTVPRVDAGSWELQIDGQVDHPFTLSYAQLLKMPMIERDITLTCVSNEVGGHYVGSARWLGVRLRDVLERAGVRPGADQLLSTAVDGFTIGTPMKVLTDGRDALIAVGMNGQPLPAVHGYPARLVIPGLYGFVSATKWLVKLTATTYAKDQSYWTKRKWATDAPIRTSSRIDTPRPLSTIKAGKTAIGGMAWAQHFGVKKVEVRIDGGSWTDAMLAPNVGIDYWRQWYLPWNAKTGQHTLSVRATNGKGELQSTMRAKPFPSGSSGIQSVAVFVS